MPGLNLNFSTMNTEQKVCTFAMGVAILAIVYLAYQMFFKRSGNFVEYIDFQQVSGISRNSSKMT